MNSTKIKLTFDMDIPVRLHNAIYKDINNYLDAVYNNSYRESFFISDVIQINPGEYYIPNWMLHKWLSQGLFKRQPNVGKVSIDYLKKQLAQSL